MSNIDENSLQMQTAINMLDQFHSSFYRKQFFVTKKSFEKLNLQRIKYITLFQHTEFRAVFRTQSNIYDGAFSVKIADG